TLAPVEANEVFLRLPTAIMDGLERDGIGFFRRAGDIARFVCRFDSTQEDADALLASLRRHAP
ncbi:MAG: low specificity L-threonine aldolase, partial [Alphaproteobacteria bacterium]|nr:low specificity L-threonine aldolase [Alphaproteobacteria bacterium]